MHVEYTQEEKEKKWSWNSICSSDFFPVGSEDILKKSQTLPRVVAVFPEAPEGPDPGFKDEDITMKGHSRARSLWWGQVYIRHSVIETRMTEMLTLRK